MNWSRQLRQRKQQMTHVAMALAAAFALAAPGLSRAANPDLAAIRDDVAKQHDASVKRPQDWIALPSIAAENLNSRAWARAILPGWPANSVSAATAT